MEEDLIRCGQLLLDKKLTIAFAESATAGRMASEFSLIAKAGQFLKGGIVCYDACIKEDFLKVPHELIEEYTPESMEVTRAAAKGLSSLIKADLHVAVTGLPDGGGSESAEKPVGTMFIVALYQGEELFAVRKVFKGDPPAIVLQTVKCAAKLLVQYLAN